MSKRRNNYCEKVSLPQAQVLKYFPYAACNRAKDNAVFHAV